MKCSPMDPLRGIDPTTDLTKSGRSTTELHGVTKPLVLNAGVLYAGNNDREGRKEMFYLTTHSTHFIYSYMASDIW